MFSSLNRAGGRIARGMSASGRPTSANPNKDAYSQYGERSASNMRYNIAKNKNAAMLKNETATAEQVAKWKTARQSKARNAKFNADFNAMKQQPFHSSLNTRQNWSGNFKPYGGLPPRP